MLNPLSTRPGKMTAMEEAALLKEAIGVSGRRISREPFGSGVIAGFEVEQDGRKLTYFVDTSGQSVPEETGMVLPGEDGTSVEARIWLHPADPRLPSLKVAAFGSSTARILERLGIAGTFTSHLVAYRAGKRAVLRLSSDAETLYLKVVPPERTERIAGLHGALRAAGVPVPAVRSWSPNGLIVIDAAAGLSGPEAACVLDPDQLLDAVDLTRLALRRAEVQEHARPSLASRAAWYCSRLSLAMPDVDALTSAIRGRIEQSVREVTLPDVIHGDLHLGQLFFDNDAVSGLIDVDTCGIGDVADDSAAFVAHARVSAMLNEESDKPDASTHLHRLADAGEARWLESGHARALTAMHLVAHALGAAESGATERVHELLNHAQRLTTR